MAKERKVPDFSPNDLEYIGKIQKDVLENPGGSKSATEEAPKPRPMLPNYYAKGGPVGRVGAFGLHRSKPDFAGGGPRTNFKSYSKK